MVLKLKLMKELYGQNHLNIFNMWPSLKLIQICFKTELYSPDYLRHRSINQHLKLKQYSLVSIPIIRDIKIIIQNSTLSAKSPPQNFRFAPKARVRLFSTQNAQFL